MRAATGLVALLVIQAKFAAGAWMVVVAIPALIGTFLLVNRHYRKTSRRLRAGAAAVRAAAPATNEVVLYVEALDPATRLAAWYAHEIAGRDYHPIWVSSNGKSGSDPRGLWWDFSGGGVRIEKLARRETAADTVLDYVWALPRGDASFVTLVIPETFERPSLVSAVAERRTTFALKLRLLSEPGIAIANVPVVTADDPLPAVDRVVGRVLVSGVQAASLRALNYMQTLELADAGAVFFAFDESEARRMEREWSRAELEIPLEIVEASYRDLGDPLLRYLRDLTIDPEVLVSVVMPELVFSGWRKILHNQRALYIKRLLLFEPRVVLSSVPYHLP